jgi:hypothetical protein
MTLEKVPGSVGKFRDTKTGQVFSIDSYWEVDLFSEQFSIPVDGRSAMVQGQVKEDFILQRLLYTFASDVPRHEREVFKHHGRVIVACNDQYVIKLPALVLEYSAEAVAEIVRLIQTGDCSAGVDEQFKPWVTDAARVVMQGWKLSQQQFFRKDSHWSVYLEMDEKTASPGIRGTIVGLGFAKRPATA